MTVEDEKVETPPKKHKNHILILVATFFLFLLSRRAYTLVFLKSRVNMAVASTVLHVESETDDAILIKSALISRDRI